MAGLEDQLRQIEKQLLKKYGSVQSVNSAASSGDSTAKGINDSLEDQMRKNLLKAAQVFKGILQKHVDAYYDSYEPRVYQRTYAFKNSIKIDTSIKENNGEFTILVYFDDDMIHESVLNGPDGYVPILLNEGYSWDKYKKESKPPLYHFGWYSYPKGIGNVGVGYHFVERAILEFNSGHNIWGFEVKKVARYNGKYIK